MINVQGLLWGTGSRLNQAGNPETRPLSRSRRLDQAGGEEAPESEPGGGGKGRR